MQRRGFTLIELLVAVTILVVLIGMSITGYSSQTRSARNARRKVDLEQIRTGLELYKSNKNYYPLTTGLSSLASEGYIQSIPLDPLNHTSYGYKATSATGVACNNTTVVCTNYLVGTTLEVGVQFDLSPGEIAL